MPAHHFSSLDNLHTNHIEGKPPPYASKRAYQRILSSQREHYLVHRASEPQLLSSRRLSNSTGNLTQNNSSYGSSYQKNNPPDGSGYASSELHRRHNSMYETPVTLEEINDESSLPHRPMSCDPIYGTQYEGPSSQGRSNSWELKFIAGVERLKARDNTNSQPSLSTSSTAPRRHSSYEHFSDNDIDDERSAYLERRRSTPRQYSSMELLINTDEDWQKTRQQKQEKSRSLNSSSQESPNASQDENQKTQTFTKHTKSSLQWNDHDHKDHENPPLQKQVQNNHKANRQGIRGSIENEKVTSDSEMYLARVVHVLDTHEMEGKAEKKLERNKEDFHIIDVQRTEVAKEMPLLVTQESSGEQDESNSMTEHRSPSSSSVSSTASSSIFSSYISAQQHQQDTGGRPTEDSGLHTATPIFLDDSPPASPHCLHDSTGITVQKQEERLRSRTEVERQRKEAQQQDEIRVHRRNEVQMRVEVQMRDKVQIRDEVMMRDEVQMRDEEQQRQRGQILEKKWKEVHQQRQYKVQMRNEVQVQQEEQILKEIWKEVQQQEVIQKQKVCEGEEHTTVSTLKREVQQLKQMKEEIQQHLIQTQVTLKDQVHQLTSSLEREQQNRQEERVNREQIIQNQQKDLEELRRQVKHLLTLEVTLKDTVRQLTINLDEEKKKRQEEQASREQVIQGQQKDMDELRGQVKYLQTLENDQVRQLTNSLEDEQRRQQNERANMEQIIQDQQKDLSQLRSQVKHLQTSAVSAHAETKLQWQVNDLRERLQEEQRHRADELLLYQKEIISLKSNLEERDRELSETRRYALTRGTRRSTPTDEDPPWEAKEKTRPKVLSVGTKDPPPERELPPSTTDDPSRKVTMRDSFMRLSRLSKSAADLTTPAPAPTPSHIQATTTSYDHKRPQFIRPVSLSIDHTFSHDPHKLSANPASADPRRAPIIGDAFTPFPKSKMVPQESSATQAVNSKRRSPATEYSVDNLNPQIEALETQRPHDGVQRQDVVESRNKVFRLHPHPPAHHLLCSLLSWLHSDLATDPGDAPLGLTSSVISSLFHGLQESVILCPVKRDVVSSVPECFDHFTLTPPPGPPLVTLQDLVTQRLRPQEVVWGCGDCRQRHTCTHITRLLHLPDVLVFILNYRSKDNSDGSGQAKVEFPATKLTLHDNLVQPAKSSSVYDLVGVCSHQGTISSGHFTAYCRSGSDRWWLWDDMNLEAVQLHQVLSLHEVHILFYQATQQD
ncbi:hypothetical protein Pmani_012506 [Petrolisthes manimaculis]|uniref:USP domain-containing protein n=1 Tax=Petrolisthes manimaculis TaxID=1843537 RepID=A0AAE1UAF6_9EUCA|nr:hypothetical protein Pmani_012506 [Petrolisthes manimaculis]